MVISTNKPLKLFITLMLILVIMFNFTISPYAAEPITTSLVAIKVLALIATSMGIMVYIQSNGGFEAFFDGFMDWLHTVKGIQDGINTLFQLAWYSITHKVKMRVSDISSWLKEYFETEFAPSTSVDPSIPLPNLPTMPGADFRYSTSIDLDIPFSELDKLPIDYRFGSQSRYGYHQGYYERIDLVSDYYIIYGFSKSHGYPRYPCYGLTIYYKDNPVKALIKPGTTIGYAAMGFKITTGGASDMSFSSDPGFEIIGGSNINLRLDLQIDINTDTWENSVSIRVVDIPKNKSYLQTVNNAIQPLVGVLDPNIGLDPPDIPIPQAVPSDLPLPWQMENDKSISGYVGKTVDDILYDLGEISLTKWIGTAVSYPKTQLDNLPYPTVEVDSEGVITEVNDAPLPQPGEVPGTEVGLLGAILAFLTSIFEIPDDISLDFDPLMDLDFKDKFPFSLPWDVARSVGVLLHPTPKAPRFEIQIKTETIVIDFEQFQTLADIVRAFLSVIFVIQLIILTRRFVSGA